MEEAIGFLSQTGWDTILYAGLFEISILLTIIYAAIWKKSFGVYYTLIFAFIPLCNLGYVLLSLVETEGEAYLAQKVIYIGGCFLIFFITMAIFDICHIRIPKWVKVLLLYCCSEMYSTILTTDFTKIFYRRIMLKEVDGATVLLKSYGPAHTVFYIMLGAFFLVGVAAILYALFAKKNV